MNITITIKYQSPAGGVIQGGTFPLKGRSPEQVAYEWWKQIKQEVFTDGLESVVVDGDNDITDKVLEMEKASTQYE